MTSQLNKIASEIVIAKNAAASSTAKVTKLLNEVYSLKTSNVSVLNFIDDLSNQVLTLNNFINNDLDISFNSDLSFSNFVLKLNKINRIKGSDVIK